MFAPDGAPPGRAPAELPQTASLVRGTTAGGVTKVTYTGPLPAALGVGS